MTRMKTGGREEKREHLHVGGWPTQCGGCHTQGLPNADVRPCRGNQSPRSVPHSAVLAPPRSRGLDGARSSRRARARNPPA
eukprot:290221-Chlamydomonas_euryale.AAC.1